MLYDFGYIGAPVRELSDAYFFNSTKSSAFPIFSVYKLLDLNSYSFYD